jgi:hypothetical protein
VNLIEYRAGVTGPISGGGAPTCFCLPRKVPKAFQIPSLRLLLRVPGVSSKLRCFLRFVHTARDELPYPPYRYRYGVVRVIGRGDLVHSVFLMRIRFELEGRYKQVELLTAGCVAYCPHHRRRLWHKAVQPVKELYRHTYPRRSSGGGGLGRW